MKKILLPLFLAISVSCAQAQEDKTPKKPAIQSASQALARFQELRKAGIEGLSAAGKKRIAEYRKAPILSIGALRPGHFFPEFNAQSGEVKTETVLFGKSSAVAACKDDFWVVSYDLDDRPGGGLDIYLDGVTGKILFIRTTTAPEEQEPRHPYDDCR